MLLGLLVQRGDVFERVKRHDAVIVVRRHEKGRRPLTALREVDVVQWGVPQPGERSCCFLQALEFAGAKEFLHDILVTWFVK